MQDGEVVAAELPVHKIAGVKGTTVTAEVQYRQIFKYHEMLEWKPRGQAKGPMYLPEGNVPRSGVKPKSY